jgi:hypothetical protein
MDRKQQLENEIFQINAAIDGILKGGQSYNINSGGGSRATTNAALETLYKRREKLEYSLACMNGETSMKVGIGW